MAKNEVAGLLGERIETAAERAVSAALRCGDTRVLVFNGARIAVNPNSSVGGVVAAYNAFSERDYVRTLTATVRAVIAALERTNESGAEAVVAPLRAAGIVPGMHVGLQDLPARARVEWYAGQILEVVDAKAWYTVNSLINCRDKFAPEIF